MESSPRRSYGTLLRNANYLRVFSAGLGSVAGSAIAGVCLIWLVAEETHSALDVGLLGVAWVAAAILFSVFGGTLVDRYDRRRLMITADLARAAAMALVTVQLVWFGFDLYSLLAAYAVVGAFTTIFNPAEQALIPSLVPTLDVPDANGLVRSSRSALQFVGSAIAGVLLISVGAAWGLGANAVTFALSAALLTGMRLPRSSVRAAAAELPSYFSDLVGGLRWLWGAKAFLELTASAAFFNFCFTVVGTFLVFFATISLHGSALEYALLLAAETGGTAIGALLVGRVGAVRWAGPAWTVPYGAVSGGVLVALALWPSLPLATAALFALGALSGFAGTAWLSAAQLLVPPEVQGRYFGVDGLGSIAILPVAQVGGAFLIADYGPDRAFLAVGLFWIAAGLVFLIPGELRRLGYRPRGDGPATLRTGADGAGTSGSHAGTRGE